MIKTNIPQLRLLSDEELDREFAAPDHDESTRTAILYERVRRASRPAAAHSWVNWTMLAVALLTLLLAAVAAWPVLESMGEKEWFDL